MRVSRRRDLRLRGRKAGGEEGDDAAREELAQHDEEEHADPHYRGDRGEGAKSLLILPSAMYRAKIGMKVMESEPPASR